MKIHVVLGYLVMVMTVSAPILCRAVLRRRSESSRRAMLAWLALGLAVQVPTAFTGVRDFVGLPGAFEDVVAGTMFVTASLLTLTCALGAWLYADREALWRPTSRLTFLAGTLALAFLVGGLVALGAVS